MKRIIAFSIASLCSVMAFAEEIRTSANTSSATVYLQGASLVQKATASVAAGSNTVVIDGLSNVMDLSSLKIKADGGVVISSYDYSNGKMNDREVLAQVKCMRDSLAALNVKLSDLQNASAVDNKLLALLSDGVENKMKTDIAAGMEYYRKNAEPIYKRLTENSARMDALKSDIKALEKRIADRQAEATRKCGLLTISLSSPSARKVNFELKYYVANASWSPAYDINVPAFGKEVSVSAKAVVRQNTGLKWKNVMLTLSNSSPSSSGSAPELYAWRLKFYENMPFRSLKAAAVNDAMVTFDIMEAEEESASFAPVEMVETNVSVNYVIDRPYTIESSGVSSNIELFQFSSEADYYYYAVPKMSSDVFLKADIKDWEKYNLLPGSAMVTFDGSVSGKTYINPAGNSETLSLTLGIAPSISVSREVVEDGRSKSVIGSNNVQTSSWKTSVRNSSKETVKVLVKDQYPISADSEIEVKLLKGNTPAAKTDAANGIVTWELQLKPSESSEILFGYSVKYPKDKYLPL